MLINISSERSSGGYVPTLPFRMGDSHFEKRAPVFPALSEMGYSRKKTKQGERGECVRIWNLQGYQVNSVWNFDGMG